MADKYWVRSPSSSTSTNGYAVSSSGTLSTEPTNNQNGVRPATNIKATTRVNPTGVWKTNQAGDYVQVYEIVYNQDPILTLTSPSNNRDILMIHLELEAHFYNYSYGE